ncbi:MAG: potassium-transporting ATPase subunit B, partial [Candidatus Methanoperedens sp.]
MTETKNITIFEPGLLRQALWDSLRKLNPLSIWRNPVMLLVEIGSIITTVSFLAGLFFKSGEPSWFTASVSLWLWLTVIFSNFAESLAEGRGKARAESLRKTRTEVMAKKLKDPKSKEEYELIPSGNLHKGDYILVNSGDIIPGDGEVVEGAALVNESSVTGESAPVVRESGGDRSAVTGGTKVISNQII